MLSRTAIDDREDLQDGPGDGEDGAGHDEEVVETKLEPPVQKADQKTDERECEHEEDGYRHAD